MCKLSTKTLEKQSKCDISNNNEVPYNLKERALKNGSEMLKTNY